MLRIVLTKKKETKKKKKTLIVDFLSPTRSRSLTALSPSPPSPWIPLVLEWSQGVMITMLVCGTLLEWTLLINPLEPSHPVRGEGSQGYTLHPVRSEAHPLRGTLYTLSEVRLTPSGVHFYNREELVSLDCYVSDCQILLLYKITIYPLPWVSLETIWDIV